ncbi:MAG: hypothetical protein RLY93_17205 [Sumerlaeia bacterium]
MIARARQCIADVRDNPLVRATSPFRTWWGRMWVAVLAVGCLGVGIFCVGCFVADVRQGGIENYRAYFHPIYVKYILWLPIVFGAAVFLAMAAIWNRWKDRLEEIGLTETRAGEAACGLLFWPVALAGFCAAFLIAPLVLASSTPYMVFRGRHEAIEFFLILHSASEFSHHAINMTMGISAGVLVASLDWARLFTKAFIFFAFSFLFYYALSILVPEVTHFFPDTLIMFLILEAILFVSVILALACFVIPLCLLAFHSFRALVLSRLDPVRFEMNSFRGMRRSWNAMDKAKRVAKVERWKPLRRTGWNTGSAIAISVVFAGFCPLLFQMEDATGLLLVFSFVLASCFSLSIFSSKSVLLAGTSNGLWRFDLYLLLSCFTLLLFFQMDYLDLRFHILQLIIAFLVLSFPYFLLLSAYLYALFAGPSEKRLLLLGALSLVGAQAFLWVLYNGLVACGADAAFALKIQIEALISSSIALFFSGPILLPLCIHYIHRRHFAGANPGDIVRIHRGKSEVLPCPVS